MRETGATIFIVDPNLLEIKGHHFTLSSSISIGALGLGYGVTWLVNKNFNKRQARMPSPHIKLLNVFSNSIYTKKPKKIFYMPQYKIIKRFKKLILNILSKRLIIISVMPEMFNKIKKIFYKKIFKKIYKVIYGKKHVRKYNYKDNWRYSESAKYNEYKILSLELTKALERENISQKDHIIIHTADLITYWAIFNYFIKNNFKNLPFVHICTPYSDKYMPYSGLYYPVKDAITFYNLLGVINYKVFLYAENALLANYFKEKWCVPVRSLELPPPNIVINEKKLGKRKLNVVYLGAARKEKGFMKLPEVVSRIYSDKELRNNIYFTIQCSSPIAGYENGVRDSVDELANYENEYVKLINRSLSVDEYYDELGKADIVILCYDRNKYNLRGSGIAVESLSTGKIIIATRGTYPAIIGNEAAVSAESAIEIVSALGFIVENYNEEYGKVKARALEYRKKNSAKNYVTKLVAIAEKGGKYRPTNCSNSIIRRSVCSHTEDLLERLMDEIKMPYLL